MLGCSAGALVPSDYHGASAYIKLKSKGNQFDVIRIVSPYTWRGSFMPLQKWANIGIVVTHRSGVAALLRTHGAAPQRSTAGTEERSTGMINMYMALTATDSSLPSSAPRTLGCDYTAQVSLCSNITVVVMAARELLVSHRNALSRGDSGSPGGTRSRSGAACRGPRFTPQAY